MSKKTHVFPTRFSQTNTSIDQSESCRVPPRRRTSKFRLTCSSAIVILTWSGFSALGTVYDSDGSVASVQYLHDNWAQDGDTITLPAGTFSWTTRVTITKGITLSGQSTTDPVHKTADDQTIILVGTGGTGNDPLINLNSAAGKSYRITGVTFRTGRTGVVNSNGMVILNGNSQSVRVDHCHFNELPYENNRLASYGPWGVVDHNVFDQTTNAGFPMTFGNQHWNGDTGNWGDKSWAEPPYYGSEKFMFVEDNCFLNTSGVFRGAHDACFGARFVFRHNHCYDMGNGSHGTEVGRSRGVRAIEIYGNDYHWTIPLAGIGGIRSGSFLMHDNTHDGLFSNMDMTIGAYRTFANDNPTFGASTGENPWDYNVTEADGTHVDGHPPYLFDSGTCSAGSNGTTLVDTGKTWAINQWVGYTAETTINGINKIAKITANTATVLTVQFENGRGTAVVWAAGMTYNIRKFLISMDQPCRGAGDMIVGQTPINQTTNTPSWVHQALEPCYSWNNVWTPTGTHVNNINPTNSCRTFLLPGHDYFNDTAMPGYRPYVYPHPLVSPGPSPTPTATGTPSPTPTSSPTPTTTPTATPCVAIVPNLLGIRLSQAQAAWQAAGFTTTVVMRGPRGRNVVWQSIPFGTAADCNRTVIAVSSR